MKVSDNPNFSIQVVVDVEEEAGINIDTAVHSTRLPMLPTLAERQKRAVPC